MQINNVSFHGISLFVVSTILSSQMLMAQTSSIPSTGTLEEIVVTAQRREQSLQEVPISLEVFTGESILQQGYEDLTSLQSFTPNLYLESNARNSDIMIRGTGTLGSNLGFEQAVPVFADGVHYGRGSQITNAFLDIERVEILRGPQPVYFGQNATAGAISLTTRKPGKEWEGYVNSEYGNDNKRLIEIAGGGPITDTFGIRVAGKYHATDGHLQDVWSGDKFPQRSQYVGRVSAAWTPYESLEVNAKLEYMELELGGMDEAFILTEGTIRCSVDAGMCALNNPAAYGIAPALAISQDTKFTSQGSYSGPPYWEIRPEFGIRRGNRAEANILPLVQNPPANLDLGRSNLEFTPGENVKPFVAVADVAYTFSNEITLSLQTAYSYLDRFARVNHTDNGPFVMRKLDGWEEMDQYSQEIRVTSADGGFIEWMGGIYWQMQNLDTHYVNIFSRIQSPGGAFKEAISSQDSVWMSGFATLVFNLTEQVALDIGGRYSDVDKSGNIIPYQAEWVCAGGALCLTNPTANLGTTPIGMSPIVRQFSEAVEGDYETNDFNFQTSLRWNPTEDISLFGKYANAFKAGGFDFGKTFFSAAHAQESQFEFKDEFAWSTEAGLKASMLDGKANLEATIFYSEFKDLQRSAFDVIAEVNRVTNAAKQSVKGIEVRGSMLANDNWQINFSGSLLDGRMDSFPGATCTQIEIDQSLCLDSNGNPSSTGTIDCSGQVAVRSPDWSFVVGTNYWMPLSDSFKTVFNGQVSISDGFILSDTASRVVDMPKHADLNLSIGFGPQDDVWILTLFGRHLTNPVPQYNPENDTAPSGFAIADINANMLASYGLQFRYNY